MCRARCITHQGRVISATGVHNHPPHMKGPSGSNGDVIQASPQSVSMSSISSVNTSGVPTLCTSSPTSQTIRIVSTSQQQQQQSPLLQHLPSVQQVTSQASAHLPVVQHIQPPSMAGQHMHQHHIITGSPQAIATQNVLSSNNLMHQHHLATSLHGLINTSPMLNPLQHQHHVLTNIHPPPSLQITPVMNAHLQTSTTNSPRNTIMQPHQTVVQQQLHESPSPNHNQLQQHQQTHSAANNMPSSQPNTVVVQTNSSTYTIQHQSEDSNQQSQQTTNQGQNSNQQQTVQNVETQSQIQTPQSQHQHQQQQQQNQQSFKMEHI